MNMTKSRSTFITASISPHIQKSRGLRSVLPGYIIIPNTVCLIWEGLHLLIAINDKSRCGFSLDRHSASGQITSGFSARGKLMHGQKPLGSLMCWQLTSGQITSSSFK